jgi:hypothetical protein
VRIVCREIPLLTSRRQLNKVRTGSSRLAKTDSPTAIGTGKWKALGPGNDLASSAFQPSLEFISVVGGAHNLAETGDPCLRFEAVSAQLPHISAGDTEYVY